MTMTDQEWTLMPIIRGLEAFSVSVDSAKDDHLIGAHHFMDKSLPLRVQEVPSCWVSCEEAIGNLESHNPHDRALWSFAAGVGPSACSVSKELVEEVVGVHDKRSARPIKKHSFRMPSGKRFLYLDPQVAIDRLCFDDSAAHGSYLRAHGRMLELVESIEGTYPSDRTIGLACRAVYIWAMSAFLSFSTLPQEERNTRTERSLGAVKISTGGGVRMPWGQSVFTIGRYRIGRRQAFIQIELERPIFP